MTDINNIKHGIITKNTKLTKELMILGLKTRFSKPLSWFKKGKTITVSNKMQKNYTYKLVFAAGTNIKNGGLDYEGRPITYPNFEPAFTPKQMLNYGVFEGKYCNDQIFEYPKEWYDRLDKLSPEHSDPSVNYFKIKSRQPLQEWIRKKWIPCHPTDMDTRGWFEWYCRYWCGRRQPAVDVIQIKRWYAFIRHYGQYIKNTKGKGITMHPKRRQALLQWSWPCME